jgi:hypothetical protein
MNFANPSSFASLPSSSVETIMALNNRALFCLAEEEHVQQAEHLIKFSLTLMQGKIALDGNQLTSSSIIRPSALSSLFPSSLDMVDHVFGAVLLPQTSDQKFFSRGIPFPLEFAASFVSRYNRKSTLNKEEDAIAAAVIVHNAALVYHQQHHFSLSRTTASNNMETTSSSNLIKAKELYKKCLQLLEACNIIGTFGHHNNLLVDLLIVATLHNLSQLTTTMSALSDQQEEHAWWRKQLIRYSSTCTDFCCAKITKLLLMLEDDEGEQSSSSSSSPSVSSAVVYSAAAGAA